MQRCGHAYDAGPAGTVGTSCRTEEGAPEDLEDD